VGQDIVNNDLHVNGTLTARAFSAPAGAITNAGVAANAAIDDTKLKNRSDLVHSQSGTVAAATQYLKVMRAAGTVLLIEAAITETIATGADRTITIDLAVSTGGGAFASILTGTIGFTNASVLRDLTTGSIASPTLVDGDILRLTVAVAGAAGNQALGLVVNVQVSESPA
jgi:hypothetical protein